MPHWIGNGRMISIERGDIVIAELEPVKGSEQGGVRPVLVIQNNLSNRFSPTIIIVPITTKIYDKGYPTNVLLLSEESGLRVDSTILLNQIRTIDKSRVSRKICRLNLEIMRKVDLAIGISLGLN